HGELPDILLLFRRSIEIGMQPIFAAISLLTESAGPTLFIPVPYELMKRSTHAVRTALWVNGHPSLDADLHPMRVEGAAGTLSHALANISYAARISDRPIRAWLARAHLEGGAMYLPDVTALREKYALDVISVSTQDEPFLGMASALYLPLADPLAPGRGP